MARPKKPAALRSGHHESITERKAAIQQEQAMGGNNDNVSHTPKQLNPLAKKYYHYITTNLKVSGVLTNLDVFVVAETAICLSRMRKCDEIIDAQGMLKYRVTKNGYKIPYEHPAVNIKSKYMQQFKSLSTQLGLTPSSRSQLASADVENNIKKQDPLNNILNNSKHIK